MNCQSFESIVNELARQQIMDANPRDQALAHAGECEVCALRLEDEQALTLKLRDLTTGMSGLEAPARIEGELLTAFRTQKSEPRRSTSNNWRYWAAAVAAILLIVIGIAAMSMRSRPALIAAENPYIPPFRPAIANANRGGVAPVTVIGDEPAMLPKPGTTIVRRNPRRHPRTNSADSRSAKDAPAVDRESTVASNYEMEIATDFLPLGYASPMSLQDGGQVMRVELPRSTLAGFGLPVNMDRVNERVKADVLVGTDGQARAIRFVQ